MLVLASTLTQFEKPSLTAEQWRENDRRAQAEERRQADAAVRSRLLASGIPAEFRDASVAVPEVASWLSEPGYGLLLKGRPGRGKTHEACGALKVLAASGSVRFVSADDLVRGYASALRLDGSHQGYVNGYTAPRALVVDDLGKEEDRWSAVQTLFAVLDRRGQRMRPTIVTTNMDGKALLARYSERGDRTTAEALISRLSRYKVVEVGGADRRLPCA